MSGSLNNIVHVSVNITSIVVSSNKTAYLQNSISYDSAKCITHVLSYLDLELGSQRYKLPSVRGPLLLSGIDTIDR